MSWSWKLMLGLALVLQTAWSTTVEAYYDTYCSWSIDTFDGLHLGHDSGGPMVWFDATFYCSNGFQPCGGTITICWVLWIYNSDCTLNSVPYSSTGGETLYPPAINCDTAWPTSPSFIYDNVYLPNPPTHAWYYQIEADIYRGNDCGITGSRFKHVTLELYCDTNGTWSTVSGCGH